MDETDYQILKILQKKARIPNVEVARTVGMAPSAILERIKKLEARGIIQGYEVRLNPEQFNCSMTVFIQIKLDKPASVKSVGKDVAKIDQVQEVHYLAGEDCLLVKLKAADNKELEKVLSSKITCLENVLSTKTLIALSTFKESAKIKIPKSSLP